MARSRTPGRHGRRRATSRWPWRAGGVALVLGVLAGWFLLERPDADGGGALPWGGDRKAVEHSMSRPGAGVGKQVVTASPVVTDMPAVTDTSVVTGAPAVTETGAASQASAPEPSAIKAEGPHTDKKAAEHFRTRWGSGDPAVKHLKDIRTVGGYLRIYTDLPEEADNSKNALTLCERGLDYLREQGVTDPVVFVQAEFGENGNPILANILGPADTTCRVTHPDTD
ncbi:hypothetical protein [Nonomuraea endophytica]|uniref:hypothetical protein n=1 Tax=Nonomuraea endophytica TaxID=714136 RepID=UPI0037C5A73E